MQEFEAKFTGVDIPKFKEKLQTQGFVLTSPETLMVRKAFHIEGNTQKWARVRDEGDKITLTIKEIVKDDDINGVKEAELIIQDFDEGANFLKMSGFYESAFQETKREKWQKGDVEVMIDTWPGLSPFVEVEAPTAEKVEKTCIELGFNMADALYGAVDVVYLKELGITGEQINTMPVITFRNPPSAQMLTK